MWLFFFHRVSSIAFNTVIFVIRIIDVLVVNRFLASVADFLFLVCSCDNSIPLGLFKVNGFKCGRSNTC